MQVSQRDRRVLIIGGVVAAAIVGWVYVVEPMFVSRAHVHEELEAQRRILDRRSTLAADRQRYEGRIDALRAALQQNQEALFTGDKLPVVAAEIQGLLLSMSQESGITIVRQNLPTPKRLEMLTQVSVELSVRGELKAIRDFLYHIQTGPKLLTVPKVAIRGVTSRTNTALTADVQVSGFVLGGEEKPAPAGTGGKGGGTAPGARGKG
jgi:Tfp pilus assembly protein PilO